MHPHLATANGKVLELDAQSARSRRTQGDAPDARAFGGDFPCAGGENVFGQRAADAGLEATAGLGKMRQFGGAESSERELARLAQGEAHTRRRRLHARS